MGYGKGKPVSTLNLFVCAHKQVGECLRERQRDIQRDRDRERIPSRLHTVSTEPNVGLDPMNQESDA